jgi:hypothetical protein
MFGSLRQWLMATGVIAVAATAAAGPAMAHDNDWKHKRHHKHFVAPGPVYYVERPVVYAPPPRVVYQEAPVYYGPPAPPSINFNFPLR